MLNRYVPKSLIERPKTGLGVPIDSWLRGPLRAWAEALLDETPLRREAFLIRSQLGVSGSSISRAGAIGSAPFGMC